MNVKIKIRNEVVTVLYAICISFPFSCLFSCLFKLPVWQVIVLTVICAFPIYHFTEERLRIEEI